MKTQEKQQIANQVLRIANGTSQNRVAKRVGTSSATISQIINGNWDLIKDSMWRKIKVKLKIELNWVTVETKMFKKLNQLVTIAQKRQLTVAFSHQAGTGKSELFNHYHSTGSNVIYVEGNRTMSKKTYIKRLLNSIGHEAIGTTQELNEKFIDVVSELKNPVIIIDQFDKLKDGPFDLFMDFYNELFNHCGFVISGVPALRKRIINGVNKQKIGYDEIWSRMNRKFIELPQVCFDDVKLIFEANGVQDEETIHTSYNCCEGDLRRVRQDVMKYQLNN
ncbi:MAG: AAA family ATPase [Flavobacteriales bacterium]